MGADARMIGRSSWSGGCGGGRCCARRDRPSSEVRAVERAEWVREAETEMWGEPQTVTIGSGDWRAVQYLGPTITEPGGAGMSHGEFILSPLPKSAPSAP